MNRSIIVVLFLSIVGCVGNLYAQEGDKPTSIFDAMRHTDVLKVKFTLPLDTIMSNKRSNEKFAGEWSFVDGQGNESIWDIDVKIRGKYRRMKCVDVPPLKIKFSKKDLKAAGLSKANDFKIVNYCAGNAKEDRELLLKEYLTYKLYNQITDISYQVILLEIEYIDAITKVSRIQTAFLIEDTGHLRKRINANKNERIYGITQKDLDPSYQKQVALFQSMIGNNDWAFNGSKNVKLVEKDSTLIPVPYDFDFSGIVNAPYARASIQRRIHDKLEIPPIYHGFETRYRDIKETIKIFFAKKKVIYETIKSADFLCKESRREMRAYLDTFYNAHRKIRFANVSSD